MATDTKSDKDEKDNAKDKDNAKELEAAARKKLHEQLDEDYPEEKAVQGESAEEKKAREKRNKDVEERHKLIDAAPVIAPFQNPPHGYPRVEVAVPGQVTQANISRFHD